MNILYIANHLNVGGITSYIWTLAAGMKGRGHQVFVASGGGQMQGQFEEAGVKLISLPMRVKQELHPKIFISAVLASVVVRRHKIDLIHTQTRTTHVAGWFIRRFSGVPQVTTCHGFYQPCLARRLFPFRGNMTIAISEPVKAHLRNDLCVRSDIRVIINGIDVPRFAQSRNRDRADCRRALGVERDALLICIIARLADVKGHKQLIEAMHQVVRVFPSARLLIVGEGKMKPLLEGWVSGLNLSRVVTFVPTVIDTRDTLCALDIFVLPSLSEGLGLALMEAMAAGCAVIGSDVGGIKQLIRHEYNGLLVPPGDSRGIAAAISRLLQDPAERCAIGIAAQETAVREFSRDVMIERTEEVYRTCLGEKR